MAPAASRSSRCRPKPARFSVDQRGLWNALLKNGPVHASQDSPEARVARPARARRRAPQVGSAPPAGDLDSVSARNGGSLPGSRSLGTDRSSRIGQDFGGLALNRITWTSARTWPILPGSAIARLKLRRLAGRLENRAAAAVGHGIDLSARGFQRAHFARLRIVSAGEHDVTASRDRGVALDDEISRTRLLPIANLHADEAARQIPVRFRIRRARARFAGQVAGDVPEYSRRRSVGAAVGADELGNEVGTVIATARAAALLGQLGSRRRRTRYEAHRTAAR